MDRFFSLLWPAFDSSRTPESSLIFPAFKTKLARTIQRLVGRLVLLPFGAGLIFLMRYARGYRIDQVPELRARFRSLTRDRVPTLICANHLTFIDSALILWALASNPWYVRHYRCFSWNLPAGDFFKKKFVFLWVAYLSKCIFLHRDGTRDHKNSVLGTCRYLLEQGEYVSIFPEGRRSRIGRFDREHLTHGVGKIIAGMKECRVICVYLRGDRQQTFSDYPPRGSRFTLLMKEIYPRRENIGQQGYADVVGQIGDTIADLEREYFAGAKSSLPKEFPA